MLQKRRNLMHLMISWALVSCATPPNFTACANLETEGHCVEYMTHKKYAVDNGIHLYTKPNGEKLTWKQVLAGAAVLPSDQLAIIKTFFDNFCHQNACPNNIGDWNTFARDIQK